MSDQFHATTEGDGGSPLSEGLGDASRHAAELAAAAAMAMQMWTRARDQREQARMVDDQRGAEGARAELRAEHAAARLGWAPALEPQFERTATSGEAARAWASAQPWVSHDSAAADAAMRAETVLRHWEPDLMARFDAHREAGMEPTGAMCEATHDLARDRYGAFLPPQPMRGVDAGLYNVRNDLGVDDTLRVWDAARLFAERDPQAQEAMTRAEDQLRRLRPAPMADYDQARTMGAEPLAAMQAVAPDLRQQVWQDEIAVPGRLDTGEAEADRTVAQQQRGEAAHDLARADLPSTPGVDERAVGATQGANHHELADARGAQAESLVGKAFPETIHTALATRGAAATSPAARLNRTAGPSPGRRR